MQAERSGRSGFPGLALGDEDVGEDQELAHGGDETVVETADVGIVAPGVPQPVGLHVQGSVQVVGPGVWRTAG